MSPLKANSSLPNFIKTPIKLFNKPGPLERSSCKEVDWNLKIALKIALTFLGLLCFLSRDGEYNLC